NGVFLNFAKEPKYVEVYVPKENSDWLATTTFSSDDILEISGTVTNLNDGIITVGIQSSNNKSTLHYLSRGTFIHNKVLAKAQFRLFLSIYIHAEEENKRP